MFLFVFISVAWYWSDSRQIPKQKRWP